MSKYRITLEGRTYEMEVELVPEEAEETPASKLQYKEYKGANTDPTVRLMDPSAQHTTVNNSGVVTAPMPGTVVSLKHHEGDSVSAGDVVLVLEAMKMENEITAPTGGTITKIACTEGKPVGGGDVLFEIG